jgi:hypothetical protein
MALIIVLQNVSNLAPVSDYKYQVLVGDGTVERSKVLTAGTLRRHERADGWVALVRQFLDAVDTSENRQSLLPPPTPTADPK